ncbi:uncharacterized protein LOC144862506 [Branchiostoma floridae x Branchiostoma japonicum]
MEEPFTLLTCLIISQYLTGTPANGMEGIRAKHHTGIHWHHRDTDTHWHHRDTGTHWHRRTLPSLTNQCRLTKVCWYRVQVQPLQGGASSMWRSLRTVGVARGRGPMTPPLSSAASCVVSTHVIVTSAVMSVIVVCVCVCDF